MSRQSRWNAERPSPLNKLHHISRVAIFLLRDFLLQYPMIITPEFRALIQALYGNEKTIHFQRGDEPVTYAMQRDDFEAMIARAMQGAKGIAANEPTVTATAKKSMAELYFEWVRDIGNMSVKEDIGYHDTFESLGLTAEQSQALRERCEKFQGVTIPGLLFEGPSSSYDVLAYLRVKQLQRIAALSVPEVDFLQGLYRAQVATQGFQSFQLQERIAQSLAKKGIVQYKPDAQGYQVKIHDQWSIG